MSKKNIKREKVILNSEAGDEPCMCKHPRRSHLGDNNMCFGCYTEDPRSRKWLHAFTLDNLALVEQVYNRKELAKYKTYLEKFKDER